MKSYELTDKDHMAFSERDRPCNCDIEGAWKAAQKRLLEYLDEPCAPGHSFALSRKDCSDCWQSLIAELKEVRNETDY